MRASIVLTTGITRSNWVLLLIGVFLVLASIRGLSTGNVTLFVRDVTRAKDGYLYWFAISMGLVCGVASLGLFIITVFNPQYLPDSSR